MPLDAATFSDLVDIYQGEVDSLIDNLGKQVILFYESTITNVSADMDDKLRRELRKPNYKDQSQPTVVQNTESITALIKYDPNDFENFGIKINNPQTIVRLKTYLSDVPKIMRCSYMIPGQSRGIINSKYKLIREPIPVGLKEDRYAISFWERI